MSYIYNQQNSFTGETEKPLWLTEKVFGDFLNDSVADFKSISKFSVDPIKSTIKNSIVQWWQVRLVMLLKNGKSKTASYILETPLALQQKSCFLQSFERESVMYEKLLPSFEALYKNAGKELKLSPPSYKLGKPADPKHVLLSDLKANGYGSIGCSSSQMDIGHAKGFLQKLAAFHAASVVYADRERGLPKAFEQTNIGQEDIENYKREVMPYERKFNECLRLYDLREYQDQLKIYQEHSSIEIFKLAKVDRTEFNVLLHGQCNAEHILYHRDAFGNIKDTLLTNFHSSRYGSPAMDLWYFLLTTVRSVDKVKNFDFYVKYYHNNLVDYLKFLNYRKELPKISDLHISMMKYSPFGFNVLTKDLPMIHCDVELKEWQQLQEYEKLKRIYENSKLYKEIGAILPWMYNRGLLEV